MPDDILHLSLHPECLKLDDPRINKVRAGKMSVEVFTLLLEADDPFVIIGDTIYALTEQEYYASRSMTSVAAAVEATFKHVTSLEDISFMSEDDQKHLNSIKEDLPTCPECRYKRHKDAIYQLAKKYSITVQTLGMSIEPVKPYPKLAVRINGLVSDPVMPIVSNMMSDMYNIPLPERQACIDCVRKHVASAYILAGESYTGYPEHISIVNAHLGEAITEMPKAAVMLKQTLEFCMARTSYTQTAFVPLGAIMAHLRMLRADEVTGVGSRTEAVTTLELDLTDEMREILPMLPDGIKKSLLNCIATIEKAILEYKNEEETLCIGLRWEGAMSVISEQTAQICPAFANMIRNRRLMFRGSPPLMIESGYTMQEIKDLL